MWKWLIFYFGNVYSKILIGRVMDYRYKDRKIFGELRGEIDATRQALSLFLRKTQSIIAKKNPV